MSPLAFVADVLDREEAREAARRELSKTPYREAEPPWTYRALQYVLDKLDQAFDGASASLPAGTPGRILLGLLLVGLIAVVVARLRPSTARGRSSEPFLGGEVLSAAAHRDRADTAAAQGRWADAVRERLRAVARELETRGVLDPRAGRTADELAREAGDAVPALAGPLARGTRVFDDIWYGGRVADAAAYALLVEVDDAVRGSRLVRA